MAVVCTACSTENRDAAKFCRGCGARLGGEEAVAKSPASWAQTQPADITEERTVLVAPVARAAPRATPASDPAAAVPALPSPKSRAPLAVGILLIALLVGAVIWWWLGARDSAPSVPPVPVAAPPMAPQPPSAVVEAPAPALAPELSPLPPTAVPSDAPVAVEPAASPPLPPPAPAAAPRPRPTRNAPPPAAAPEPAPAPVTPAPAPVAAPAPPPPAAVPSPDQACASLGFIARARCMAAECAKPSQARHPQCVAVRQQQQLEERIRNPEGGA